MPIAQLCREQGIVESTFYKWKARFSGIGISEAKRLRQFKEENAKLKRLLADAMLKNSESGMVHQLWEAQNIIERWREDHNQRRPHSALGKYALSMWRQLQHPEKLYTVWCSPGNKVTSYKVPADNTPNLAHSCAASACGAASSYERRGFKTPQFEHTICNNLFDCFSHVRLNARARARRRRSR